VDWEVTLAFTGEKNQTGSRIAQAARQGQKIISPAVILALGCVLP
jgi:hypothetical protein